MLVFISFIATVNELCKKTFKYNIIVALLPTIQLINYVQVKSYYIKYVLFIVK